MPLQELRDFSIHFDSPQLVYYPGQTITGHVQLDINQTLDVESLLVTFIGKASTHWTESHGVGKNQRRNVDLCGKVIIVKTATCLLHANDEDMGAMVCSLPSGSHEYQFSISLPTENIPSTFEGEFGYIRYILKAKLLRPGKDATVKRAVVINELIDANNEIYASGDNGETFQESQCFCKLLGHFHMTVDINRKCYCPGETMFINVTADNSTNKDISELYAKLVQQTTYLTKTSNKTISREICAIDGNPVERKSFESWEHRALSIPATQPTTTTKAIVIRYQLLVGAKFAMEADPMVTVPVIIGTIPYIPTYGKRVKFGTTLDPSSPPKMNILKEFHSYPPPRPEDLGYPDIHPPSYSAVIGARKVHIGTKKDSKTYGNLYYTPVYTFSKLYDGLHDWKIEKEEERKSIDVLNIIVVKPQTIQQLSSIKKDF